MAGLKAEFDRKAELDRLDETILWRTRSDLSTAIDNTILNLDEETPKKMAKARESKFSEHVTNAVAKAQADAIRETGKPDLSVDQVVEIAREHGGEHTAGALEALYEHIDKTGLDDFFEEYKQTAPDSDSKRRELVKQIAEQHKFSASQVMDDIRAIAAEVKPSLDAAAPTVNTGRGQSATGIGSP